MGVAVCALIDDAGLIERVVLNIPVQLRVRDNRVRHRQEVQRPIGRIAAKEVVLLRNVDGREVGGRWRRTVAGQLFSVGP